MVAPLIQNSHIQNSKLISQVRNLKAKFRCLNSRFFVKIFLKAFFIKKKWFFCGVQQSSIVYLMNRG